MRQQLVDPAVQVRWQPRQHVLQVGPRIVVPATAAQVIEYLAKFAGNLSVATLERRLISLHKAHLENSLKSPTVHITVKRTMQGIRRTFGTKQKQARPMVKDDLLEAMVMIDRQNPIKAAQDRALLLVGFASAMRRSELVAVMVEHLTYLPNGVEIFLPPQQNRPRTARSHCLCALREWRPLPGARADAGARRCRNQRGVCF